VNTIVRCPRTGCACSEEICRERHWCRQLPGLSHRGLPLKRKFRPRCCAKTRAGVPCIMRVLPRKRRCRFHGGLSTGPRTAEGRGRIAEAQRRRWRAGVGPLSQTHYRVFVDPSGGSADTFTLAVSHRDEDKRIVIDAVRERRPPFSPSDVVDEFAALVKLYGTTRVVGDRYAGEFPRELFRRHSIDYVCAEQVKSDLFRDLLPRLNSGSITLPRSDRLVAQLVSLERTVSRGGKDTISHPVGGHDDLANAVAGAASIADKSVHTTVGYWCT
jgi:hypothetical protein